MKNHFGCPIQATSNVLAGQVESVDRLASIVQFAALRGNSRPFARGQRESAGGATPRTGARSG